VLGSDKHYSFRLSPSFSERVPALYMYLNKQRGDAKKVAFVGPNDETGWGNSKVAKDYAKEYGLDVVFEDFVQRGTNDFFPVLTKVMSKNPDVIIPLAFPPGETTLLLQQAHQLGYKKIMIAPAYFDPNLLIAKAGPEAVEGFVFLAPDMTGPSSTAGMRELYKGYNEKYKEEYNPIAFPGYVFLWVLKMAIEKAGTLDTTVVAKTMENLEGEMPYGRFSMGGAKTYGAKRQIVYPIFLSQFKNGKAEFIQSFTPPVP
jgi:branched-chain amino acid transport system substrate-binding protein